jgi:putative DNA primase/helicase
MAIIRRGFGAGEDQGWEIALWYNEKHCKPTWDEAELGKKFQNGLDYGKGAIGQELLDFNFRRGALLSTRQRPDDASAPATQPAGQTETQAATTDAGVAVADAPPARERSNVRVKETVQVTNDLEAMSDRAKRILASDPSEERRLYQRGGKLVQLALDGRDERTGETIAVEIAGVETVCVIARTSTLSRWIETTPATERRPASTRDVLPPTMVAQRVLTSRTWPVPILTDVAACPTLRPDGSLISRSGYDARTGIYVCPPPELRGIEIPELPTREQARAAYRLLRDVFREFPFVKEHHGAALVAFLLSAMMRATVDGPCPIFALKAPQSDSGKSLAVDCISIIAMGRTAPRQIFTDNDEEAEKRIAATLGSGRALCLVDNVTGRFGGQAWDATLSARTVDIREFGQNTSMRTVVARTVFCVTGNNLRVRDDMTKRTCPSEIDPKMDKPGERSFDRPDLEAYCRENRRELVTAALTLLAAYLRAGMPGARQTTGPFRSWSRVMRGCIEWATWEPGMPLDPKDGAERGIDPWGGQADFAEDADTTTQADAGLAFAWHEAFKDVPKTAQEAFAFPGRSLRDAIEDAVGKNADALSLGTHVGKIKGKTFAYEGASYRFERGSKRDRRWRVDKLK